MSYHYLDAARRAVAEGDYKTACAQLLSPSQFKYAFDEADPRQLREWAERERDHGYGLTADCLYWLAIQKESGR